MVSIEKTKLSDRKGIGALMPNESVKRAASVGGVSMSASSNWSLLSAAKQSHGMVSAREFEPRRCYSKRRRPCEELCRR